MIGTTPDTFAIVPGFQDAVVFEFDERISERAEGGSLDDAVVVSPRTGEVRVGHERRSIVVEIGGGWQDGVVYRVTLMPRISDLFGNRMRDPFEIVFSKGGVPPASSIAGLAWDRITGASAGELAVHALEDEDSTLHVAVADTGGVFAFRHVPQGRYSITAFEDRNRNGEFDPNEPSGLQRVLISGPDTVILSVPIVEADTTAAVVTSVSALDSQTVVIEFDDFVDPVVPVRSVGVGINADDEGGESPTVVEIMHEHEYAAWVDMVADSFARLDSIDAAVSAAEAEAQRLADSLAALDTTAVDVDSAALATVPAADSAEAPADTVSIAPPAPLRVLPPRVPPAQGARRPVAGQGQDQGWPTGPNGLMLLPSRRIVVRLGTPLTPNVGYTTTVTAVRNLRGVPLGGGEAALVLEPPEQPEADSTTADTSAVMDTSAVVDTAGAVEPPPPVVDTLGVSGVDPSRVGAVRARGVRRERMR